MIIKILKWTGIVLLTLVLLLVAGYVAINRDMEARFSKKHDYPDEKLFIRTDSITLARGRHLSVIKGCQDCHGADLGGKIMIEDKGLGRLTASNLTRGRGGLRPDYSRENWLKAMRHGVDPSGRPLIFMPSHETTQLSAEDLSALIAYCESVPPVNRELPSIELGPVGKVMGYFDKLPLLSVEKIDHQAAMLAHADTSEGVAQGKYLAISCTGCHRANLKGGDPIAPGLPPVPDITASGKVGEWSREQFVATLRTGRTPSGHQMKTTEMPWQMTAQYENKEIGSLYLFLKSIH